MPYKEQEEHMFRQHRLTGISAFVLFLATIAPAAAMDTLTVSREFVSPISNPTAIEWDGHSFWISNIKTIYVFKLDDSLTVVDSIYTSHSRIAAIAFKNADMWIAIDSVAKDTLVGTNIYNIFRFYRINIQTGGTVDSISLRAGWVNAGDTGYICGLAIHNDSFYVTLNAGYSSGIYVLDSMDRIAGLLNYLPLSGISFINGTLWGIRRNAYGSEGNWVTDLAGKDLSPLALPFYATDIAFNGDFAMVCDMRDSKLMQIHLDALDVKLKSFSHLPTDHHARFNARPFINCNTYDQRMESRFVYFNLKGRKCNSYSPFYKGTAAQVLIQAAK
jgi:hypothetical protein